jgi:hypothetical protein
MSCRLPLNIGTEGQDDFGGMFGTDPFDQLGDAQLLWTDPVERGKPASESMIATAKDTGTFQGKDVSC